MAQTEGVQGVATRSGPKGYTFSDAEGARRFLREFRFPGGQGIELVMRRDKSVVNVLTLDDFAVVEWASEIRRSYLMRGIGYLETAELH